MKTLYLVLFIVLSLLAHGSPPVSPNALFVVGNTNLNSGDLALKNRLQTLGYTVTVKSAVSSAASDATGKNLVIISSTVASGDVSTKFTNVPVPLINYENALFDDLEMAATSTSNYGSQSALTQIKIIGAGHPLAAGLPNGNVVVYTVLNEVIWAKAGSNAIKIATLTTDATRVCLFGYESGVLMDGLIAPARRVGIFLDDDGANLLTAGGVQLLDAAITWAANLNVVVTNAPPTINITAPASGVSFAPGNDILISANASDGDGNVTRVKFFAGSNPLAVDSVPPYAFLWENVPAGNYTVTARGYDNKNDSASAAINIIVEAPNLAPSVSITNPIGGTTFIAPAAITINANASDDGSIVKVLFYSRATLLGMDSTDTYSFIWTNVPVGNYTITAIATDNGSKSTTSSAVNITVEDTTSIPPPKNVLLIVGNTTINNGDLAIKNRLQGLDFTVTVKSGTSATTSDATAKNLVFISSTVTSTDINSKFTNVAVPVVLCENGLFDDLKMTAGSGNYGSQTGQKQITIANSVHPLAAGLANSIISVYTSNETVTWGKPTATASIIAFVSGQTSKASIFCYETGAAMQGLTAPARRVGFFLYDNSAALLTPDGWKLFDATIGWAANSVAVVPNGPPAATITGPANNATFTTPATVNISANASDSDGSIAKVEFYEGNNLLGTDLNSPYSFAWNNVAAGNYVVKAKAFDDDNATTFSGTINITVTELVPVDTSNLPLTVSITNPKENAVFIENTGIPVNAAVQSTGPQEPPYLKVTNVASSYKKMKLGYADGSIYGQHYNLAAGGNNRIDITLTDFNGTAQWSKIQLKPNSSSKSPSSLQTYVTAAGGIGSEWKTISIPFSAFSGFNFTDVSYLEFPGCMGAAAFTIGIQKIIFTGGSTPFLWFGDTKTDNDHDGQGASGQLLAQLIAFTQPVIDKVEFYQGGNLLSADVSAPFEFLWNNVAIGNYTLTARAYQSNEFVLSKPVHIGVQKAIGDTLTVVVTFNNTPSTYSVQKAALKYNKDFAYSYTIDDGGYDGYRIAYKMFSGGLNGYDNLNYPGMFYTDGCGNNIAFKAGLAWNSVNGLGQDLHESHSMDNRMTWAELVELHAMGWDVFNHSLSHAANGDNTDFVTEIVQNVQYVKQKTGIDMTHFVVPSGDERYVTPAFDNGMIAVYDQTGSGFYPSKVQVDAPLNFDRFKLKRHFIQNSTDNQSNVAVAIDEAANASVNGNHYWFNDATHNTSTDFDGTLQFPVFKYYMEYVNAHYGKDGSDRMWMAPLQEVYEYLVVKQTTVVSTELNGNQLTIKLLLSNVPDKLRRYALTLNIDADADFNSVSVNGTSSFCFDGIGNNKLINLDWTANHPDKIFKASPETLNESGQLNDENESFRMHVSPNPATEVITVKFTNRTDADINIGLFDLLGRNVLSRKEKLREGDTQLSINLSELNSGVYFIKAWADGTERIEKFVKR